jgi:hypothetical protein
MEKTSSIFPVIQFCSTREYHGLGGEKSKMKRRLGVGTVLAIFLAIVVLAACVAPALATTTYNEYINAVGTVVINLPNHQPEMQLAGYHYEPSSNHGAGNHIQLWLSAGGKFVPVAILTTSSARAQFDKVFWAGFPMASNVKLVSLCDIQVFRIGKTVIISWEVPIKGTITGNIPGTTTPWSAAFGGVSTFEVPPGFLILNGYGDATTSTVSSSPLPSLYTVTQTATVYNAHGTFLCPSWHYLGSVADTSTMSTEAELTISHP